MHVKFVEIANGLGLVCMVTLGGFPPCFGLPSVAFLVSKAVHQQSRYSCRCFLADLVCGFMFRGMVCARVWDWICMCASSDVLQFAHVGGSVGVEGVSV